MDILSNCGNWERYNDISFYLDAFMVEMNSTWLNTPYENEINNIAYFKSLASFVKDTDEGEHERRQLLRSYMKPAFDWDDTNDPINKQFPIMPSDNLYVKRAIRNLCIVYTERPAREIEGKNNETLTDALNKLNYDYQMLKMHRLLKLTNELAVTIVTDNQSKSKIKYLTPDNYRVTYDDWGNPIEMWIPYYKVRDGKAYQYYKVWTKDTYVEKNSSLQNQPVIYNGKSYNMLPNPFKEIPYSFVKMEETDVNTGLYELIKAQLDCNKLQFLANENLDYNGFAVWLLMNFDLKGKRFKMGPGKALVVDGVNESGELPPSVETISPTGQYLDIEELKERRIKKTLKALGLPTSVIEDNPGLQSGIAMKIDRMELDEARKEDIQVLRTIEDELVNKFSRLLSLDPASKYKGKFGGEYITNIDYIEQSQFIEPDIELTYQTDLFTKGLITPVMYVNRLVSNDMITTDEEAIKYIQTNKELFKQTQGVEDDRPAGTGVQPDDETGTVQQDDAEDTSVREEDTGNGNTNTNNFN